MKKIILVVSLVISAVFVTGNIYTPRAWISEILVDSTGNWTLEMGFFPWDNFEIDSIRVVTSSGSSIITSYTLLVGGGFSDFDSLSVITNTNLASPFIIDSDGDFVKLISYVWGDELFDSVAFGDYPGSKLDCLRDGESIICYEVGEFCIDSSPTIGAGNDNSGYLGSFSGIAYDTAGNPFTEGIIYFPGNPGLSLYPNSDGVFDEDIVTKRYTFDTIERLLPPYPWTIETYTIEPVDFCMRPDSSYVQDVVTISLVTGVKEKSEDIENMVVISPNPFSDKVVFYFNLKNEFSSGQLNLSIYDLNGRKVHQVSLCGDQKRYECVLAGSISSGTYIYRLEKDKQLIKTGKFVRL
jgi:hypothetical protein